MIEAKKEGSTLTGVEIQSARYTQGLISSPLAWCRPLPINYESTGIETQLTQGLDPQPRARAVFAFLQPETLAAWVKDLPIAGAKGAESSAAIHSGSIKRVTVTDFASSVAINSEAAYAHFTGATTFLSRMQDLPPSKEDGLWPAQIIAIRNLKHAQALRQATLSKAFVGDQQS